MNIDGNLKSRFWPQNGDDADDNQQLDQSKAAMRVTARPPESLANNSQFHDRHLISRQKSCHANEPLSALAFVRTP